MVEGGMMAFEDGTPGDDVAPVDEAEDIKHDMLHV